MLPLILAVAAAVILIFVLYKTIIKLRDKAEANHVIRMSLYRQKPTKLRKQACSFCHKKASGLSFYANEQGSAVGVCDLCRPIAERRALLRL